MENLTLDQLAVLATITRPMLIREIASIVEKTFGVDNLVVRACCWHLRQRNLLTAVEDKLLPTDEGLTLAMNVLDFLSESRIKFLADCRKQRII